MTKKAPAKSAATTTKTARKSARKSVTRKTTPAKATAKTTRKATTKAAGPKPTVARKAPRKPTGPRLPADLKLAIKSAQDKQAIDLTVLDLRNASAFTDFFVVCTGANVKQVQAIADGVMTTLKADGQPPALIEGYNRGEWVLLDYFTFIVHIFLPAQRRFYDLERLWGGAEAIEVSAT